MAIIDIDIVKAHFAYFAENAAAGEKFVIAKARTPRATMGPLAEHDAETLPVQGISIPSIIVE